MVETSGAQGMEVVDLRFESLRDLQEDFGPFLSPDGFFLSGRKDFAVSEVLRFRLMLPGEFVLIEGVGVVVWVRRPVEANPTSPFGAAIGFATLSDQGRELVERIVHSHVENGGTPFDMSRPAENGDSSTPQPDLSEAEETSGSTGPMKFTIREDSVLDIGEPAAIGDAEQQLLFEPEVTPELEELIEVDSENWVEDSVSEVEDSVPLVEESIPLMEDPVQEIEDSVPLVEDTGLMVEESAISDGFDGVGVQTFDPEPPEPAEEALDMQEDPGQPAFWVENQEPSVAEPEPEFSSPQSALEISFPTESDSRADGKDSWRPAEERFESLDQPKPKSRSGLIWTLIAVMALVGVVWIVWTQYAEFFSGGEPSEDVVTAIVDQPNEAASPPEAVASLSDEDLQAAVEAAVDAATVPEFTDVPEPEPTEVPIPADAVSGPASNVVEIKTDIIESGTAVLIRADGSVESRRIATSLLLNPPRVLVRISGIDSLYRPFVIPVGTSEVREIRIGHHPETRPPSLWIVLDRTDEDVEIRDVQTSGNVVRIEVGR